ncbi:MAG: hypothetical protein Q7T16_06610 [Candidatus Burarchaeum sp.]|nr:prepilin peptidase [Candidatus Burarchaeum sp.]MDO8340299.1 hypothetical protein [Candidatus Burarchaeum sp.]
MTGEIEVAGVAVALVGTAVATYYDLTHNRNVPDWLSFGMLGLGVLAVAAGLAATGFTDWQEVAGAIVMPAAVVLGPGYLLYRAGQIGGADVVIFAAIALLMPAAPGGILEGAGAAGVQAAQIVQIPFVFVLFLVSGILFGIATFARYLVPCMRAAAEGKVKLGREQKLYLALLAVTGAVFVRFAGAEELPAPVVLVFLIAIMFSAFFYIFKAYIAQRFLIRIVGVKEIDEEDVLAVEEMEPGIVAKYGLKRLLTRSEIARLAKIPIKKFPVYKNMPAFLPYVLAALALSILFGDFLARALLGAAPVA